MNRRAEDNEADQASSSRVVPQRTGLRVFRRIRQWRALVHELQDSLEFWRERDPEENERGRLPDGEEVHLTGIWVVELYLPSTIDQLIRGIEVLGWSRGRTHSDEDLREWIRVSRSQGGGGWTSLGLVSSPSRPHFASERVAELPSGVRAAFPYLYSVSSAMTALVILFVIDDERATGLIPILRADYATRLVPLQPWMGSSGAVKRIIRRIGWRLARKTSIALRHSVLRPHDLRRRAAGQYLRERREACSDWVREHLPGAFSLGLGNRELPGAQLLITEVVEPLSEAIDAARWAYEATGLSGSYRAWRADEWPAVRLAFPDAFRDESSRTLTVACRRADSYDPATAHIQDQSNWSIAQYADDRIRGLLIRWGSSMLLAEHRRRLSVVRDLLGAGPRRHSAVRNLKRARELVAVEALDAEVTATEIKRVASDDLLYRWDVLEPVEARPIRSKSTSEPARLLESLRLGQIQEADELTEQLRLVMGAIASSSNITAAISSLRLQRLVLLLTAISITIASWAAFVAATK